MKDIASCSPINAMLVSRELHLRTYFKPEENLTDVALFRSIHYGRGQTHKTNIRDLLVGNIVAME